MREKLSHVHGLEVEVVMGGLTQEQCALYSLPVSPDCAKANDPNLARWHAKYPGQAPTELDALHPKELQDLVERTILHYYDDELMEQQRIIEREDEAVLKEMRKAMFGNLIAEFPGRAKALEQARDNA